LVEHFDGLLWVALRSTAAMPVIAPPLAKAGRLLIDGGVLNNLPIDVMRAHFSGKIFAVDVSTYDALLVGKRWDLLCPSGFEILFDKLNPFTPKADLPNIFEILHRTATLSSGRQARQARAQADVLITPPVERFSVADFDSFDEIVEMGYRNTLEVLEALDKRK
jgi:predicted acylesterase/phospholipase RssA